MEHSFKYELGQSIKIKNRFGRAVVIERGLMEELDHPGVFIEKYVVLTDNGVKHISTNLIEEEKE